MGNDDIKMSESEKRSVMRTFWWFTGISVAAILLLIMLSLVVWPFTEF